MFSNNTMVSPSNPNNDIIVTQPPDDTISALEFSPAKVQKNYLIAGSWDNSVRCWEVEQSGLTIPKAMQFMSMPILDVCWGDDGTKVFMASCNSQVNCWDLESNQSVQVAAHDAPVKTCHWIKAPTYTCLMTSSWDKTLKFWDVRSSNPMMTINLPERAYCADVDYPIAVIGTASLGIAAYTLESKPQLVKSIDTPLKYQHCCLAIFRDKKKQTPTGICLGNIEGHVAITYFKTTQSVKDNFIFKCHRLDNNNGTVNFEDVYAVNDVKVHPVHGTLATVGSDGTYVFWDKDARLRLKSYELVNQPITKCCFNSNGHIFAYSIGYDWSKGHEYNDPSKKPQLFLKPCFDDLQPKNSP